MEIEELEEQIQYLFNPEPDEDGFGPLEYPHRRLKKVHRLEFPYMESSNWEGSTMHHHTRLCGGDEDELNRLARNLDMPERLMMSALRLLAESVATYHNEGKREGEIRYYPAIVLTFWSGFEAFVRRSSKMLLLTVPDIPTPIRHFLQETEEVVSPSGSIKVRTKYQSVLDRYSVFIFHAYGHKVDKGSRFWQNIERAKKLRDYYTHLDVNEPRAITTSNVLNFIEWTLLGLIWPSSITQRTFLLGQYFLYNIWVELEEYANEYKERPLFLDWYLKEPRMFHCNFEGVDAKRFPSVRDKDYHEAFEAKVREHRGKKET